MTASTAGKLRALAVILVMGCWAVVSHYASSGAGNADVNAALGIAPLVLIAIVMLWQLPSRLGIAAGALVGAALIFWLWPQLRENVSLLYYLQHLGAHLALGTLFGRSLLGSGDALITRLARSIYGDTITERKVRYTRQATLAWTLFFFGNALFAQPIRDVVIHRQAVEQRAFLKNHADFFPHGHHLFFVVTGDVFAVHKDLAGIRFQQSKH